MRDQREGAYALALAGIIVILLGTVLLVSTPETSHVRWLVAFLPPGGGVAIVLALGFWLDAKFRHK